MTSRMSLKGLRFFLKDLLPFFIVAGLYPVIIFFGFTFPDLSEGLTRLLFLYNISFVPIYLLRINVSVIKTGGRSLCAIFSMLGTSLLTSTLVILSGAFTRKFNSLEMILERYSAAFDSVGKIIAKWIVLIPLCIILVTYVILICVMIFEKNRDIKT